MLISQHIKKVEVEAQAHGITSEQLRRLVTEFWQIEERDPDNFAELVEVVLC